MGSSPVDKATQTASSAAAQQVSATQAANAANQTAASNKAYGQVASNVAPIANPASLTQTGLNGSYGAAFNAERNANNQNAQNATSTTLQDLNNRGMGATPAGFAADQQRQALQSAASTNAGAYSQLALQQQQDAINQFQYGNNALQQQGAAQLGAATSNNSGAAGTNTSLYGTASQQKPSALGTVLGGVAGIASAGAGAYKTWKG